jgi:protein-tyrosine phosphatase
MEPISSAKTVIFLCAANQGRSVLAEFLFRQFLAEQKVRGIRVASAGVSPVLEINRRPRWQVLARLDALGIDARGHRSKPLTEAFAREAALLVAMNNKQRALVLRAFPEIGERLYTVRGLTGAPERPGVPDIIFMRTAEKSCSITLRAEGIIREAFLPILRIFRPSANVHPALA